MALVLRLSLGSHVGEYRFRFRFLKDRFFAYVRDVLTVDPDLCTLTHLEGVDSAVQMGLPWLSSDIVFGIVSKYLRLVARQIY